MLTFFGRGKSSSSSFLLLLLLLLLLLAKEMPSIYFKNGDSLPTAAPALAASLCSRPTASAAWAPGWLQWQAAADGLRVLAQKSEL